MWKMYILAPFEQVQYFGNKNNNMQVKITELGDCQCRCSIYFARCKKHDEIYNGRIIETLGPRDFKKVK